MKLFTIGYGGRKPEGFLTLLREHGVRAIVDIRLRPDRASWGVWVKATTPDKGIESWLIPAGIEYRSLVELGNIFRDLPDWVQRYRALLVSAGDLLTDRLDGIPGPICLMCAEKRVAECHRRLVAEYLVQYHGAEVVHIE